MLIGELSARTGVSRRSLRYYEEQGLLVPARTASGYRVYADDAVTVVAQIQGLFAAGLDSADVGRFLACARGSGPQLEMCPSLRVRLRERFAQLEKQVATLESRRALLSTHLAP